MTITIAPAGQPGKPGYKTSELWVAAVAAIIALLNRKLGLELTEQDILAISGIAATYCLSRTWLER